MVTFISINIFHDIQNNRPLPYDRLFVQFCTYTVLYNQNSHFCIFLSQPINCIRVATVYAYLVQIEFPISELLFTFPKKAKIYKYTDEIGKLKYCKIEHTADGRWNFLSDIKIFNLKLNIQ